MKQTLYLKNKVIQLEDLRTLKEKFNIVYDMRNKNIDVILDGSVIIYKNEDLECGHWFDAIKRDSAGNHTIATAIETAMDVVNNKMDIC